MAAELFDRTAQGVGNRLMSSQLTSQQRQWQWQIPTLPRHNGADELDNSDGLTFERTPVIRPTHPVASTLPGMNGGRIATLAQQHREFISERDGIEQLSRTRFCGRE